VFDPIAGIEREVVKGHSAGVIGAAFAADGRQLRTISEDGWIRTWAVGPVAPVRPAEVPPRGAGLAFKSVAISPDGTRVAERSAFDPAAGRIDIRDVRG